MSSICTLPPAFRRRLMAWVTCSVTRCTASLIRAEPAALSPSTARNALVTAMLIFDGSKPTRVPLRLMTWRDSVSVCEVGRGSARAEADMWCSPEYALNSFHHRVGRETEHHRRSD